MVRQRVYFSFLSTKIFVGIYFVKFSRDITHLLGEPSDLKGLSYAKGSCDSYEKEFGRSKFALVLLEDEERFRCRGIC